MLDGVEPLQSMRGIAAGDLESVIRAIAAESYIVTATLERRDECFLAECRAQLYAGDTLLHVAGASHRPDLVRRLVSAGADVQARNRRGAAPLHAATTGGPGPNGWDPARQAETITALVESGAAVDAVAAGGVTALHRAVRNRCSAAVRALLDAGADPALANDSGSTATDLTQWTTGRGGSGSPDSEAEMARIVEMLRSASR